MTKRTGMEANETAAGGWQWDYPEGGPLVIALDSIPASLHRQLALHGLKQKIADAGAISRDPETGRSATWADKREAMARVAARLVAGEWNAVARESAGTLFVRALMEVTGRDRAAIDTYLGARTKEEVAALKRNARVVAVMDRMRATAVGSSGIDSDALLDDLS